MRPEVIALAVALVSLTPAGPASAQQADPRTLAERLALFPIAQVAATGDPGLLADRRDNLADALNAQLSAFVYYALPPETLAASFRDLLLDAQKGRVDQQLGSLLSGGGSAASRTGLATLIGFALESGAITQTVDQTTATLRANADGLIRFLSNQEVIPTCQFENPECETAGPLKNLELAASFHTSDGGRQNLRGTMPGSGSAAGFSALINQRDLAGFSARYAVANPRDPRSAEYRRKWTTWLQSNRTPLGVAGSDLLAFVAKVNPVQRVDEKGIATDVSRQPSQYVQWLAGTRKELSAATSEAWPRVLANRLDLLLVSMRRLDPMFDANMAALAQSYLRFLSLQRSLEATLVTDPALTLEYAYSRPPLQPELHTVRVAWAYSPQGTRGVANPGTLTVNAAVDRFHEPQPGDAGRASTWKSAHVAAQFDRPLGRGDAAAQLSVGAYFQYQFTPSVLTVPDGATTLPGTSIPLAPAGRPLLAEKGAIVATQAILSVRLGSSGLKVPLGVSWANRSELATGSVVRGHIGFTLDTTPLLLLPGRF